MGERAVKWAPVTDIVDGFGSIGFSYGLGKSVSVLMRGARDLVLHFAHVIALRYEDECPGFDPFPKPLPMLKERVTFPLLTIENSEWAKQWVMHPDRVHFALISSDDLVQLVAKPRVEVHWRLVVH